MQWFADKPAGHERKLVEELIQRLPLEVCSADYVRVPDASLTCTVCLDDFEEGDEIRRLPCKHVYHRASIDKWLSLRRLCPVCNHDAALPPPAFLKALDAV